MEVMFDYIFNLLVSLADKHSWLSYTLMAVGGLYLLLTTLRGIITGIVKMTKTKTDDTIVATVYAFLDKFAYGFGKLEDYYEDKAKEKSEGK